MNFLRNVFRAWRHSAPRYVASAAPHSVDRMRAILNRERMRADRSDSSFALLTLTLSSRVVDGELTELAGVICDRIRSTDDAGLLGPQCVGIVLPETSCAGAWKLAEDLCDLLPADMRHPQCDVYVYPSDRAELDAVAPREDDRPRARGEAQPMHVLFVQPLPLWKRVVDVAGASTALVLAAPLMLVVAVAVKVTSPGPIFYAQQRTGLGRRSFWMYKFRTMVVDAEARKADLRPLSEQDGPAFKLKNDPRVTKIGRLLRRTCFDEVPQLINVVKGDMSLVGPRPLPCDESAGCEGWGHRRLDVTPGLTCTWQVRGGTKVTFAEWMRMDLRYASSRSLWSDLRLVALTVPSVIKRDGVY